jgi:hypothetical protein
MQIKDIKKADILMNLLIERYKAAHIMRERSLNFAIWILGFAIAMFWILLDKTTLILFQKIVLTIFVVTISFLTKKFLSFIEIGFNKNRMIIVNIEEALGCYKSNLYIEGKALYPEEYKNLYIKKTSHFKALYLWILTVTLFLISLILLEQIIIILELLKSIFIFKGGYI